MSKKRTNYHNLENNAKNEIRVKNRKKTATKKINFECLVSKLSNLKIPMLAQRINLFDLGRI